MWRSRPPSWFLSTVFRHTDLLWKSCAHAKSSDKCFACLWFSNRVSTLIEFCQRQMWHSIGVVCSAAMIANMFTRSAYILVKGGTTSVDAHLQQRCQQWSNDHCAKDDVSGWCIQAPRSVRHSTSLCTFLRCRVARFLFRMFVVFGFGKYVNRFLA